MSAQTELRVDEAQMSRVVEAILMTLPEPRASFAQLRELVPHHVTLHRGDRAKIPSRQGEEKWFQTVRNLTAHPELHPQFNPHERGIRLLTSSGLERRIAKSRAELPRAEAKLAAAEKRGASADATEALRWAVSLHRGILKNGPEALPRLRGYETRSSRRTEKAKSRKAA